MPRGNVKRRGLVGIFTVAQFLFAAQSEVDSLGGAALLLYFQLIALQGQPLEIHGDHAIVTRGEAEDLARKVESRGERSLALGFKFFGDASVIRGVGDHSYAVKIFRRRQ